MSSPRRDGRRLGDQREIRAAKRVYLAHGMVVWAIASALHFGAAVASPLAAAAVLTAPEWAFFGMSALGAGAGLGLGILRVLEWVGGRWPTRQSIHMAAPWSFAIAWAAFYSLVLHRCIDAGFLGAAQPRNVLISCAAGGLLGFLATPVIIVRSRNRLVKMGFRASARPTEDPRWRS